MDTNDVLTTGQAAAICRVSSRTVSSWFDTGKVKGFRIPGGNDRRILKDSLKAFMNEHGLPLEWIEDDAATS